MDTIRLSNPSKLPAGVLKEYAGLSVAEALAKFRATYGVEPQAVFTYVNSAGMICVWIEIPKVTI